jgi:hypothetical protein
MQFEIENRNEFYLKMELTFSIGLIIVDNFGLVFLAIAFFFDPDQQKKTVESNLPKPFPKLKSYS